MDANDTQSQDIQSATAGAGALLQRDYWAVLRRCGHTASELIDRVAREFVSFPPPDLCRFRGPEDSKELQPGTEMEVEIRMAGSFRVQVVHRDSCSFTLATLPGHPEAGRITFGAYPNPRGDIVFHIRSRARSSSTKRRAGFSVLGEPMQTNTWAGFIDRLAAVAADGLVGPIHAETSEVEEEPSDEECREPTFRARADA